MLVSQKVTPVSPPGLVGRDAGAMPVVAASAIAELTREGCAIAATDAFAIGRDIMVTLPALGPVAARITGIAANGYHCAFVEPLPAGAVSAVHTAALRGDDGTAVSLAGRAAALARAKSPLGWRVASIAAGAAGGWLMVAAVWRLLG